MSVGPWTQFCPELLLLNHSPFCDQNLLYDNAQVGDMITFSDSSSGIEPATCYSPVSPVCYRLSYTGSVIHLTRSHTIPFFNDSEKEIF